MGYEVCSAGLGFEPIAYAMQSSSQFMSTDRSQREVDHMIGITHKKKK